MAATRGSFGPSELLVVLFLLSVTACGTFEVGVERTNVKQATPVEQQASGAAAASAATGNSGQGAVQEAIAWYGQIESLPGAGPANDYLKLWHLNVWPKFGRAPGIVGANAAIEAEIERLRNNGIFATFWGEWRCGVRDYSGCQLTVKHISANDGGPTYEPEPVAGWQGTVGRLPGPSGDEETVRYFVLDGEILVLYGVTSGDPVLEAELEGLQDGETTVRIWGQLRSKAHRTTGSVIDVERLEMVQGLKGQD